MSQLKRKNTILGLVDDAKDAILSPIVGLDPKKSPKYQNFTESVMRNILAGYEKHKNNADPKQEEIIKKWRSRLESSGFLDEVMCKEMIADLSSFIEDKDAAKKYQDAANSSVSTVCKGIKENSVKEDEIWKWQLLQMFAIMTPLGAFSVAGQVFNYLGPVMDLFGPVLGKAGIAQGVADIATSKQLGPFGKLAEIMRVDDGIKTVLTKTPILNKVIEIADMITTNENVQLLGAEFSPLMTASPMPLLAIAGTMVIANLGDDLDQRKKTKTTDEQQEATIKKLRDTMPKPKIKAPTEQDQKKPNSEEKNNSTQKPTIDKNQNLNKTPNSSPSSTKSSSLIDYSKLVNESGKTNTSSSRNSITVR